MKQSFLLFATLLIVLDGQTLAPAQSGPAIAPEFPGFSVEVTLSAKAKAKLVASNETIIVAGYLSGYPKKSAPKKLINEIGQIDLGEIKSEIHPGDVAHFAEVKMEKDALAQIDINGPQLLINVYSGRRSSKNNLLDCDVYEDALKPVLGTSIPISCKLIGE